MSELIDELAQGVLERREYHSYMRPRLDCVLRELNDPPRARYSPGGFVDIDLDFAEGLDKGRLVRFHLWGTEGSAPLDGVPHSHRCRLDSLVIHGGIVNTAYDIREGGDFTVHTAYCRTEDVAKAPTTRKIYLAPQSPITLRQGDYYYTPFGAFHSTGIDGFTVTLSVFSEFRDVPCLLVDATPQFDGRSLEKGTPSAALVRKHLEELSRAI